VRVQIITKSNNKSTFFRGDRDGEQRQPSHTNVLQSLEDRKEEQRGTGEAQCYQHIPGFTGQADSIPGIVIYYYSKE